MRLEYKRLEEVCEILDSQRIPITASDRSEGVYPYYGANGIQDYVDDYIFDDELVLLAEDGGNFGSTEKPIAYRVSGKCWVNNHAHVLKAKDMIDTDYLCYALMFYNTDGLVNGATRQKLTQKAMRSMVIPVRSKEDQKKISLIIQKVFSLIEDHQKQIKRLDELVKSRFVEMFGDVIHNTKNWDKHIFANIATSRLGKMLDAKKQTGECSFPYLANFNVQWFEFNLTSLNQMDFDEKDQTEFALKDGDLLVCEGGEIGRCAIWHNEITPCYFQKALHRVRCNQDIILPIYLAWWFKFNCENKGFSDIEGAKATISHLPGAKLKKLNVVVPPIELQHQFADLLAQIEKTKSSVKQSIEKLETLKKSLMQEYFR